MAFLGATAFRVLVAVDTVAEMAAPRPNWKDVGFCECDAQIESKDGLRALGPVAVLGPGGKPPARKQGVQTGRGGNFSAWSGTGRELEVEEADSELGDALRSPGNALKRCRKDGTGP